MGGDSGSDAESSVALCGLRLMALRLPCFARRKVALWFAAFFFFGRGSFVTSTVGTGCSKNCSRASSASAVNGIGGASGLA
eukprot:6214513-Alexandrium_andersonii.AAC.1